MNKIVLGCNRMWIKLKGLTPGSVTPPSGDYLLYEDNTIVYYEDNNPVEYE